MIISFPLVKLYLNNVNISFLHPSLEDLLKIVIFLEKWTWSGKKGKTKVQGSIRWTKGIWADISFTINFNFVSRVNLKRKIMLEVYFYFNLRMFNQMIIATSLTFVTLDTEELDRWVACIFCSLEDGSYLSFKISSSFDELRNIRYSFAGNGQVLVLATASVDKKVKLWAAPSLQSSSNPS